MLPRRGRARYITGGGPAGAARGMPHRVTSELRSSVWPYRRIVKTRPPTLS